MSGPERLAVPFGATPERGADAALAPAVSVVVPTFRRPALVTEALHSALAQTRRDIEVIVVVDGEEPRETLDALAAVDDARLSVLRPGRQLGNAGARNLGIEAARAPWIALLDDDDLWMPDKLERQLAAAEASGAPHPVVSCRFVARSETDAFVWPRRLPRGGRASGRAVGDYVLCRRRPATGDGVVQTSTVMAPAALFRLCPFDADCRRFVDVDWLLRAARIEGMALVFAEPGPAARGLAHRRPAPDLTPGRLARGRGLDARAPPPRQPARLRRLHADAALDPRRARGRPPGAGGARCARRSRAAAPAGPSSPSTWATSPSGQGMRRRLARLGQR